jgi:peptidyl-prolyl cis-trans isomerase C
MTLKHRLVTVASAAAMLLASGALAVRAQDAATPAPAPDVVAAAEPTRNPDEVVARVGEETVIERELAIVRDVLQEQLASLPPAQQRSVLVDTVVSMKLLAMAGREAGLEDSPDYKIRRDFMEMQALRNAYVDQAITEAITEADLQAAYKSMVTDQHKPQEEVRARHILVDSKEVAEKVVADLEAGGSFEELAKQSKDPSGQNGGDLGYFSKGQMVPEFENAVFALEPGAFTKEPVQSQFGWHVIKLEEKRMSEPPPLAEVEEQLRSYLQRQKFDTLLTELRAKYPVEVIGAPAAPSPEAAPAAAPTAEPAAPATDGPAEEPQN